MIDKLKHYSLNAPSSVYDEEALTALELAGRTAAKVNEVVDFTNESIADIPNVVAKDVNDHIKKGTFDEQIDKHTEGLTRNLEKVGKEVDELDGRVSNLLGSVTEGSTTLDAEVIDLRRGADKQTYTSAGDATRKQFEKKVDKTEYYSMSLELGGLSIKTSGWDYSEPYYANCRVRTKEGMELALKAGDVIGMTSYEDARMYIGWRDSKGKYYYEEWMSEDFEVKHEGEYVVLLAHLAENEGSAVNDTVDTLGKLFFIKKLSGVASMAESANTNIANSINIDFGFRLGGMNTTQGVYNVLNRYVTPDIMNLDIDIVLKASDDHRVAVHAYTNANGDGVEDLGWVTDKGDYIVKAGTYFRLMVMAKDYETEAELAINPSEQYDHYLYKAIRIEPAIGGKINLMESVKTLMRLESVKRKNVQAKTPTTPIKLRSIQHRGANREAPENTISAFKVSKKNGYDFVECDVRWTSDGVPVLLHDDSVDRTSNGSGRICELTLAQAKTLDFSNGNTYFAGEKIPTFEEFIWLCRNLELHPYIEIEPDGDHRIITEEQARVLLDIVARHGMKSHVTWISFTLESLEQIVKADPSARVGYLLMATSTQCAKCVMDALTLKTGLNESFLNVDYNHPSLVDITSVCEGSNIPLEVWSVNDEEALLALPPYITGVTTDELQADEVIFNNIMKGMIE